MTLLKSTEEFRVNTEEEAKLAMEWARKQADENGYTLGSAGYTQKQKKSKGEIIDEGYLVKFVKIYNTFWEIDDNE